MKLDVEDQCWHYKSKDLVLRCNVPFYGTIYWRRDDLFIGLGGRAVGKYMSEYNITRTQHNGVIQEELRVSKRIVMDSIEQRSKFRCENQGYSSQNLHLYIPGNSTSSMPS